MAIDSLHEKIRKLKNPLIVDLRLAESGIPAADGLSALQNCENYTKQLLEGLKESASGVRFSFGAYALFGSEGLCALSRLLVFAKELGYYVVLDAPEVSSPLAAQQAAERLLGEDSAFPCDGRIHGGFRSCNGRQVRQRYRIHGCHHSWYNASLYCDPAASVIAV